MAEVNFNLEQGARDVLNAGLGLFQTVAERVGQIQNDIAGGYQDLVSKGASDNSELVTNLRGNLDKGITVVKDVQTRVEETLNLKKETVQA